VANCFLYVDDVEAAQQFYVGVLGFSVQTDVTSGDYRWLTLNTPNQPELGITIQQVGSDPFATEDDTRAMRELLAKGSLGGLIFSCDDVDALFEHVRASGAEVLAEPADQFYGVRDCAFRDPAGNLVRFNSPLQQA
jgi:catechol 2,3-dioxygenase-like lactoylglutathione lyase family enzyme